MLRIMESLRLHKRLLASKASAEECQIVRNRLRGRERKGANDERMQGGSSCG